MTDAGRLPESMPPERRRDDSAGGFTPLVLDKTVIAVPLLDLLERESRLRAADAQLPPEHYDVIIDINLDFHAGRQAARDRIMALLEDVLQDRTKDARIRTSEQYLFAQLDGHTIRELVRRDTRRETTEPGQVEGGPTRFRAIYHIWPDFPVKALTVKSVKTVKADAARVSFSAMGEDIVWAVLDSGIDATHPHFKLHQNLDLPPPLEAKDFTGTGDPSVDQFGHGTHVAGIIGGELRSESEIRAFSRYRDEHGEIKYDRLKIDAISGMAPKCKLLSLKVLDGNGDGVSSNLIRAIEHVQEINGYGRRLRIHGVNMSVGYDFEPEWFACGQSPLCVEVDRLVRSGVVVVVAAGNTGYGWAQSEARGAVAAGMDLTINDPGNAELAITVGSTHRDSPHVYGVSYFSSKGPTGDGRLKPDLVAPGEKILSSASGKKRETASANMGEDCDYVEDSGTSMAAPHVSGVIAAFLSVRREFIGQPERVKEVFLINATDLKRERTFQGHGLVDLMRAIQAV